MAYAPSADSSLFTRRGLVFVIIVLGHVALFWGMNAGLTRHIISTVFGPIETRIIEAPKENDEAPPPPPPKIETPPPFVPPPDIAIEIPADAPATTAITQTTTQRPVVAPPPAAPVAQVPKTAPRSDPRRPLTQPEYPPSSRRAGEAGTVILQIYVLDTGRVGDAKVMTSSGYPRLDEAALREVKRSWRLTPGTENGKPVAMWGQFAVTFKLTD
jgi:periplasmic protein TonB